MVDKLDVRTWEETRVRVITKITHTDYQTLCKLHSKYFNHRYKEPCKCNKQNIRNWIKDLDNKLIK
jgi:hypothetical protein